MKIDKYSAYANCNPKIEYSLSKQIKNILQAISFLISRKLNKRLNSKFIFIFLIKIKWPLIDIINDHFLA